MAFMLGNFIFMISTPSKNPDHWTEKLLKSAKVKDSPVVDASKRMICDVCLNKKDVSEMLKCNHLNDARQSRLKDDGNKRKLELLGLDQTKNVRENMGVQTNIVSMAFDPVAVEMLFEKRNFVTDDIKSVIEKKDIKCFFMMVDPAIGRDNTAITYVVSYNGILVILGQDIRQTAGLSSFTNFVRYSVMKYNMEFRGDNTHIPCVVCVESNSTRDGDDVDKSIAAPFDTNYNSFTKTVNENKDSDLMVDDKIMMKHLTNTHVLKDYRFKERKGVYTDHYRKLKMKDMLALYLEEKKLRYHVDTKTMYPHGINHVREEFKSELLDFRSDEQVSKRVKGLSGKGSGKKDDMVLSCGLAILHLRDLLTHVAYSDFRLDIGIKI
jgi:hypothetical protein